MTQVLLRAHRNPFTTPAADRVLARNLVGDNVGNLLFSYAVQRTLSTSEATIQIARLNHARTLGPEEIDERFDHVVIPLANAFRKRFLPNLDAITETIEKLSIPVTVVGVGVQSAVGEGVRAPRQVGDAVTRFMRAVLDHSPSIGVRGEWTAEYLAGLGFGGDHVDVIGCPSMFLHGDTLPLRDPGRHLDPAGPIAFNLSPYLKQMAPVVEDQVARYPGLVYFAQDIRTLALLLEGQVDRPGADLRLPVHPDHPLIAEGRTRFPLDSTTWMEALARFPFSYGTRIHGNIAALLAGTPAYVLTHDARTLELARYHEIPHRRIDVDVNGVDAVALHAEADWQPLVDGHAERFGRYSDFLHRHGLRHVFDPGESADDFDRRIARKSFPPVVGEPSVSSVRGRILSPRLRGRLRRLVRPVRMRA
ncbi:polysaccharide pyruvyl transferase family protein [Mumia sp. ZJ1417]|uniref:polysaccharide pyruvyl transferase family protein n=1 Tax=Mumia sp. ZJ1417 TaxID=2708082 RepID=UPI0014216764|nr:polysaccharide pyruvyl transferase family protein [Mumia sp. ZJ1417]QMW67559.1 polysaccharide pyruvyl transferase family protein [Mumia sp. ZJ1417]